MPEINENPQPAPQAEQPKKQTGRPLIPLFKKKKQRKEPVEKSSPGLFSEGVEPIGERRVR